MYRLIFVSSKSVEILDFQLNFDDLDYRFLCFFSSASLYTVRRLKVFRVQVFCVPFVPLGCLSSSDCVLLISNHPLPFSTSPFTTFRLLTHFLVKTLPTKLFSQSFTSSLLSSSLILIGSSSSPTLPRRRLSHIDSIQEKILAMMWKKPVAHRAPTSPFMNVFEFNDLDSF